MLESSKDFSAHPLLYLLPAIKSLVEYLLPFKVCTLKGLRLYLEPYKTLKGLRAIGFKGLGLRATLFSP